MKNVNLWKQLEAFELDEPTAEFYFSARLARENGWGKDFARRVIIEYKRFLYLAKEAGHPVTPSDEVDQAWHLHLCYTRSYWDELCARVLEIPLHHGPTKGGEAERAKYRNWYEKTLASYEIQFGEKPPADIWPKSEKRFSPRQEFQRLDRSRYLIIDKPGRSAIRVCALACGVALVAGCAGDSGLDTILGLILGGTVIAVLVLSLSKITGGSGKGGPGSDGGSSGGWFGCGGDSGCAGSGCGGGCGGGGCGGG